MSSPPAIAIGSDHAGLPLKSALKAALEAAGHPVLDFGTESPASVDYPDFAHAACAAVEDGRARFGVLVCGSGIGMSIAANKVDGIRCALCNDVYSAKMARGHNDANVLAMGARVIGRGTALMILDHFLSSTFEGGRHSTRVAKIMEIEKD